MQTHTDQIWCSEPKEIAVVKELCEFLQGQGFSGSSTDTNKNFGYPQIYTRNEQIVSCRFVDSVFFDDPDSWTRGIVVTDNIPFCDLGSRLVSALPEFWHIWQFDPEFIDRLPIYNYNCFMNRVSGDRSVTFYELIRRGILEQGIVSYNCFRPGDQKDCSQSNYEQQYQVADLSKYEQQHQAGQQLIPYNTITETLEQSIIDSKISLVLETYTSDSHIVFSEKIFRVLQMPRPWLLYCSPGSVDQLRQAGFDVLDDYVDHTYDTILPHFERLYKILDQLETDRIYTNQDYDRFALAAEHNQNLLKKFANNWPAKFKNIKEKITRL